MPQADDIILTHLRIENFRGLELLDIDLPPSGVIFSGTKGIGKTTALEAMPAILEGIGISPDAIRLDSSKTRLSLNFEKAGQAMVATRTIKPSGTTIELQNSDGTAVSRAKEQLRAIFGTRSLDPLKLFADSTTKEERRRMILQAIPCKLTKEDINKWCETDQEWNVQGHGHEVLARVRQMFFDKRTAAGQEAERLSAAARLKEVEALKLHVDKLESMTPDAARTHVAAAERELTKLHERRRLAEEREAQAEGTRAKIAELRAKAEELMARPDAVRPSSDAVAAAAHEKADAWEALQVAERRFATADKAVEALNSRTMAADALELQANAAATQANELEAAIAHTLDGDGDPIAMQVVAAQDALEESQALVARAEASAKYRAAKEEVAAAAAVSMKANDEWERLERIVKRLTTEAPAELATRADAIPGLEITPTVIKFNRKNIELLSEGEKLEFAVEIVKRTTEGVKALFVDGIEVLPPELQPAFVRQCLKGGWALFGTRVADGQMDIIDVYQFAQAA